MSAYSELWGQKIKNDGAYHNFAGNIVSPIWRFKERRNLWKNPFGIRNNNYDVQHSVFYLRHLFTFKVRIWMKKEFYINLCFSFGKNRMKR